MVFQNFALYPHMTVLDNIAFGLRMQKVAEAETERRRAQETRPRSSGSRSCWTGVRRSCPAASASAWRWAARSCAIRRSS